MRDVRLEEGDEAGGGRTLGWGCSISQFRRRRKGSRRVSFSGCSAQGCERHTTNGKPYCLDHLDQLPSVQAVRATLARVEAEDTAAARGEASVDAVRAQDVVVRLRCFGACSPARLAIDVEMAHALTERERRRNDLALEGYLDALERAGLVRRLVLGSRRGTARHVVEAVEQEENNERES